MHQLQWRNALTKLITKKLHLTEERPPSPPSNVISLFSEQFIVLFSELHKSGCHWYDSLSENPGAPKKKT